MDIERGQLIEIGVSVTAVAFFILLLVGISLRFNDDGLSPDGGLVLIGAIGLFVLLMAGVGIALAYRLNPSEESVTE